MNNAPKLESGKIILRQPIKRDISARKELGLNIECIMMCGGNAPNTGKFTLDDAVRWYERIIQHPCRWVIEYNGNCIG